MKAIIQHLGTGLTELAELPAPRCRPGHLLIRTQASLISSGTERMLVQFGKASLLEKARQQPEKVAMVLDKIRTDGLLATLDAVRSKLAQPIQLGYCNAGIVLESQAEGFSVGDRVVSNGPHAEVILAPKHLCARIPDGVEDEAAAFTVLSSIGLQGIRLLQPTLGESIAVTGVGLIGLLTVQLLRAQGCRVLAIDFDARKLALAAACGAEICNAGNGEDPVAAGLAFSRGQGVDGVIITASTASNDPVTHAARMCRKRGRIVLVGVTGLELNRADFYHKELSFQVSCSYGPGRYDPAYEEHGNDYPLGLVRWTEQRNFVAVLDLMAAGRLDLKPLITHRFPLSDSDRAYAVVGGSEPSIGIILRYPDATALPEKQLRQGTVRLAGHNTAGDAPAVGLIGSGNYATMVLIPALKAAGARLHTVACNGGMSGVHAGRTFGFGQVTTDPATIIGDPAINTVVIATRHNSHASLARQALAAGKHVFVEKPLALTVEELDAVGRTYAETNAARPGPLLMVGFNRRFAPQIVKMRALLATTKGPKAFVMTVNAGAIPPEHWTQDVAVGGGRILGEACHFIDLLRHLAGEPVVEHQAIRMATGSGDSASIHLRFHDGSIGSIHYLANGSKSFPKERLEVFAAGRVLQLDNFRKLRGFGWPGFSCMNLWRQDKGQKACALAFLEAVRSSGASPIPFDELLEVSRLTIDIANNLRS
jgi:predicted dehydrogenase/threonine dehydrogenase-like Zn-dependent dehydrogenase